jgi:phage terminase large subunit
MPQHRYRIVKKLADLFRGPARYRVAYGGRGGAKSWGFARELLIRGARSPMRILCCRELQNSIADSVHALLSDQIALLGLSDFYTIQQNTISCINGTEFIFRGIRSTSTTGPTSIKSLEGVDIAWVEEAQNVSKKSWEILIPTIRQAGSEIWVTFNPDLETDPTYAQFIANLPPDAKVCEIGWQDNPWLPAPLLAEKDYLYSIDPEAADHVWGGRTRRNTSANVLRGRYRIESFEPDKTWFGPYYGADWGFGSDPTALVKAWVCDRTLYVEHEAYAIGCDLDDTPALFDRVPGAKDHTIRADCSRPETISHMRRHEYRRILGCLKWPGSVEDGIEHLRSYQAIVIHPRCKHTADEARLWSYKVDRLTGDVLPQLAPQHDHCMDALRYALEPIIRAGKPKRSEGQKKVRERDYFFKGEGAETNDWRTV